MVAHAARIYETRPRRQKIYSKVFFGYGSDLTRAFWTAAKSPTAGATIKQESPAWFLSWADKWIRETAHLSSQSSRRQHAAYRQILGLGWDAVPMLLGELKDRPEFWFGALREITGADPVSDAMRGNYEQMRDAWLAWAGEQGIAIKNVRSAVSQQNAA